MSDPDIEYTWRLRRGSEKVQAARFHLGCEVVAEFIEPTRDEVRTALMQILDEALGPEEIAGWGPGITGRVEMDLTDEGVAYLQAVVGESTELEQLRAWKAEAMQILDVLEDCHNALHPMYRATLGESKVEAVYKFITNVHIEGDV